MRRRAATEKTAVREGARAACPEIQWQADFVLGPEDFVEVFSAPTEQAATKVSMLVGALGELQAQALPLTSRW